MSRRASDGSLGVGAFDGAVRVGRRAGRGTSGRRKLAL